jgi:hypothetical protein
MVDRQGDQSQDEAAADRENVGPHQGRSSAAWRFLFALCCMPCMDREMNYDALRLNATQFGQVMTRSMDNPLDNARGSSCRREPRGRGRSVASE